MAVDFCGFDEAAGGVPGSHGLDEIASGVFFQAFYPLHPGGG
jgi:hypothetical protein